MRYLIQPLVKIFPDSGLKNLQKKNYYEGVPIYVTASQSATLQKASSTVKVF